MASDDEVLIKIAADLDAAVRSLGELTEAFKSVFEGLKNLEAQAGQTGVSTEGLTEHIKGFITASGSALEDVGTKLSNVGESLVAAAEKTGTTAETATQAVQGISAATETAAVQTDLFATSVTGAMTGATDAISGTSEALGDKLAPAAEQATASAGPLFATLEEGGKAATEGLGKLPILLDEVGESVTQADAQQQTFFEHLDAGTTATWNLAAAITDLNQKRDEEAATFAAFSDEQKQKTAELTQALLEEGVAFKDIAAAAGLSTDALKMLNDEQADLKKKTEEAEAAAKPFWDSWLNGVKTSEIATFAWGTVFGDALKKVNEGIADAITSFPQMISHMADVGDQAKTMATQLGLSAKEMAELKYISEQSGVPLTLMTKGLQTLSTQLKDSGSKASAAVRSIGLIPAELAKLEGADRIAAINTAIQGMGENFDGAGKYVEIFGQKGAKMAALVTEDVGKLNQTFAELGGADNQEALGDLGDEFNDLSNNITVAMDSFKRSITVAFLPSVNAVLEKMPLMGGMFLSFGSIVTDAAKSMLPMVTNMALMTAKDKGIAHLFLSMKDGVKDVQAFGQSLLGMNGGLMKFGKSILGLIPTIISMTGAVIANTAAMLVNPYVLAAAAIALLVVAIYKLIAGARPMQEVWEDLNETLEPFTTFCKNLLTILIALAEKGFGWLVKWLGSASEYLSTFWRKTEEGATWLAKLSDGIQNVIKWFQSLPIVGFIVTKMIDAFKMWFGLIEKGWGVLKGFFSWLTGAVQDYANELTAADTQKWWDEQQRLVDEESKAMRGAVSASDAMLAANKKLDDAYKGLSSSMKATLTTLLRDNSAKEIAENLAAEMGLTIEDATKVIERFDKALKDSAKSAKDNPFAKLMESAKDLKVELTAAAASGVPLTDIVDQFGKQAADIASKAALHGALDKIDKKIVEVGRTFLATEIKEKLEEINKAGLEVSRTFAETMTASTTAAGAAVTAMRDEIAASFLHGDAAVQSQITKEHDARITAINAEQAAAQRVYDERVRAAAEQADKELKILEDKKLKGDKISADELEAIGKRQMAAVGAANVEMMAYATAADEQKRTADELAEHKRRVAEKTTGDFQTDAALWGFITKKAAADELATQQKKLAFMKQNRKEFSDFEIAQQNRVVANLGDAYEQEAAKLGIETKKQAEDRLETALSTLAAMEAAEGKHTRQQIQDQKAVVEAARVAAGKIKVDWSSALSSMTDAFAKLATISGGTFGGITKNIGEAVGGLNVMSTSFGSAMKSFQGAGGLKGIGTTFSNLMTGGEEKGKGGIMGLVGGITKGLGSIMPMAGAIMAGVGAAIELGKKLWDGLTESKGERVAKEIGRDMGVKITEEMGDAISKTAKDVFNNDIFSAKVFHMADIIKAAGGVTAKNFDQLAGQLTETFQLVERGKFTADQGREVLDKNFGAFAKHVVESGKIASKSFTEIIRRNGEAGLQSKEIMAFVSQQMGALSKAFQSQVAPAKKASDELRKEIDKTQEALDKQKAIKPGDKEAEAERADNLRYMDELLAKQSTLAAESMPKVERSARLMNASFNAAIKSGVSMVDAVEQLGPGLDDIVTTMTNLGVNVQDSSVAWIVGFRERVNTNKELVESASSLNDIMLAMSNIGALNAETMADLQAQGLETYDALIAAGFSERESLTMQKDFLAQVRDAHKELGLPIDENTQKLITQAEEQGVLAKETMSTNDVMIEGFSAIIKAVGGEIPKAFQKMAKSGVEAAKTVGEGMDKTVNASIKDTSAKLNAVPWSGYAQKGVLAAGTTKEAMGKVTTATEGVAKSLEDTEWDAWSDAAVAAAQKAKDAVDAVSLGESPGGIKEIPIKLKEAIIAFKLWERQGIISADAVKESVDMVEGSAPLIGTLTDAASDSQKASKRAVIEENSRADSAIQHAVAAMTDAMKTSQVNVNFEVNTVNADGMKQAVEQQILPMIVDAVDRNNRGALTKLRQLMKT